MLMRTRTTPCSATCPYSCSVLLATLPPQRIMQLDSSNNLQTLYNTPAWPTPGWCSAFSALGSATILRMDADNGFTPELVRPAVCLCTAWGT